MPCMDLFETQSMDYKLSVFPQGAPVMSIEAASVDAWRRYAHAPFGKPPAVDGFYCDDAYYNMGFITHLTDCIWV